MPRILVVDDDVDGRQPLCRFLEKAGHEVICVSTAQEAIDSMLKAPPDLAILDLFMPGMDGAELLEIVRSYVHLQSLPVIMLTGYPESALIDRVRRFNVKCILLKGSATLSGIRDAVDQAIANKA
jgi:CheY-like chemotaxis protein